MFDTLSESERESIIREALGRLSIRVEIVQSEYTPRLRVVLLGDVGSGMDELASDYVDLPTV